jgi:hypothetical protein
MWNNFISFLHWSLENRSCSKTIYLDRYLFRNEKYYNRCCGFDSRSGRGVQQH